MLKRVIKDTGYCLHCKDKASAGGCRHCPMEWKPGGAVMVT